MYLTQGLHRAVQQQPDEVMTIFGARRRTFRAVADRVARLAGALRELGVGDGDRVAMLALNSDRYNEYLLAVPWAGAVLNPVNFRWSVAEIAYSLRDSGSRVLPVDDVFAPMLPALRAAVPGLAGLFYTGGTTGFAKGVMLSHANLGISWLGSAATGYMGRPGSRTLHAAPMFHLADLAFWGITVLVGGSHAILPGFDPAAVLSAIETEQVTDALLVPTMIQLLVDHPGIGRYNLSSLRGVVYGASPIPQPVLERAMKAFPSASFTQAYGMTELAPVATMLSPADHEAGRLRAAGRAAPHAEVRVVDADDAEVPTGTVGEIIVRGGHVMQGYWNQPDESAHALRGGWMHTGDGGYLDEDGYLYVVDRLKDMIVSGGENVYSAEVENAVARHPAVAQCAVIGVPDPDWGERVHAVVVLRPGATLTAGELREHAKTLIAGYKAPRSMEIADALPLSGAGKVLKRELRQKYWGESERQVH